MRLFVVAAFAEDLQNAQQDLDDARATRQRLQDAIDTALARLAVADRGCAPYDTRLDNADQAVRRAQIDRENAQHQLDHAGLRGRRHAKTELAAATRVEQDARPELDAARTDARPALTARGHAREQLQAARAALSSHDVLERWQFHPDHLHDARRHLDALDTWQEWAIGNTVPPDELRRAINTLDKPRREHADRSRQLCELFAAVEPTLGQLRVDAVGSRRTMPQQRPELAR